MDLTSSDKGFVDLFVEKRLLVADTAAATTQSAPSPAPVAPEAPYAAAGQTKANNITNNQVSD